MALPPEWRADDDGRILPECFLDYEAVERLFVSVRTFIAFLYVRKDDETAMKQEIHYRYLEQRTLEEYRRRAGYISQHSFHVKLEAAPFETRLKVAAKMIREGAGSRSAGFAKALRLKLEDLKRLV